MHNTLPLTRDLVLVGGGHTHALMLRMWGMKPLAGARLTLINPGATAPYSGMLPGHIAGHYTRDALEIDLVQLARFSGARLIMAPATDIDPEAKTISVAGRGKIAYDVASLDVGIHGKMPWVSGFPQYGVGAKPLDVYAAKWAAFLERASGEITPDVAVIGGGVAGVELALAMAHALKAKGAVPKVHVIEASDQITRQTAGAEAPLRKAMARLGVKVLTQAAVAEVTADAVILADGRRVASHFIVAAAGGFAHPWVANAPLPLTEDGFVRVDHRLLAEGFDDLFAAGDCAELVDTPRPKAGVFAVRAAPVLAHNLRAALTGAKMQKFKPQEDYLKLISLGGKKALAAKWGRTFAATGLKAPLWRWKNHIDRKFMHQFVNLPQMAGPKPPRDVALGQAATQPLCGGCGSKVGAATLSEALLGLPRAGRSDVLAGPGDDAAVLRVGGAEQVVTTDHLRGFIEDPGLMARIAAVHALGDIWSMGAVPQAALMSITLPRMAEPLQARTMAEILREAGEVLSATGAEIVGGHSAMGAELSIGLTLTGLLDGPAITNAGGRAGDALILTRPIGSGTVLAAEMQGKARGRDVAAMLAVMATPQGDAADVLQGATAMTDVTGFGLAGHLMAICRASGVAADINLGAVQTYAGAEALAAAGHRSTIYQNNVDAAPVVGEDSAKAALLHDPQTAGGLLAAVAADQAAALVAQLRSLGHDAAVIGRLKEGAASITLTQ
ncbi:Selenide, water dikinase [Shimia sp. SK013]|uniref:selenide, water dikinase SelD n=1 Tax=Shimia sp. SK013 TaxID=1389006 RepID=UPI0006B67E3E|nr:selenide, water dikinase SelD [Shimia sp. SK013]KPA21927.1 Selenide, water dikinase [Shimia sp. SK013]